jgi:AraC-like DNA-binding protein
MIYRSAVAVSARSAKNLPAAANVDMRGSSPVRAGSFRYDGADIVTGWHAHDLHQIEYALEGIAEVESTDTHYLLPPRQAAWIPAGTTHCTTLKGVRSIAVFFDPGMVSVADDHVRILAVSPLLREMMSYATRWPIDRPHSDAVADVFFDALASLLLEWLDDETPLFLPTTTDPIMAAVMRYTNEHLADVSATTVCAAVGLSERSLSRQFPIAANMTWRQYLLQSRLLRATALLTEPRSTVTDVAATVGFDSVSAFTRAFKNLTAETPTAYRARLTHLNEESRVGRSSDGASS